MNSVLCTPASVFLIITLIITCVIVLSKLSAKDLSNFFSWLSISIILTFAINIICQKSATVITWLVTSLLIISALLLFAMSFK